MRRRKPRDSPVVTGGSANHTQTMITRTRVAVAYLSRLADLIAGLGRVLRSIVTSAGNKSW